MNARPRAAKLNKRIGVPHTDCMGIKRVRHAVYDIKHYFVWIPKYRKKFLTDDMETRLEEIFKQITEEYKIEIDTMDVVRYHIHLFLSQHPRYSPSGIAGVLKGISAEDNVHRISSSEETSLGRRALERRIFCQNCPRQGHLRGHQKTHPLSKAWSPTVGVVLWCPTPKGGILHYLQFVSHYVIRREAVLSRERLVEDSFRYAKAPVSG